jgi:DNA-binding MarR family transcriptional regulator
MHTLYYTTMVVNSTSDIVPRVDLGYVALFLGLRVNQLVMDRMHARGFKGVRESHGYVIQHLIEKERSITELARRMEVTQQAASKVVAELARLGILKIGKAADGRAKTVRLSPLGWNAVLEGRKIRRRVEKRLIHIAGAQNYDRAHAIVSACLEALGGAERVRSRRILPPQ